MIKFPYGISDFYSLITEGYYFADRTDKISLIEEAGKQLLFLRPRRFGKSLLLSMLENYYDVKKADEFDRLFGHLAVGKKPTEKHNRYLVMKWDFSLVRTSDDIQTMENSLHGYINDEIFTFNERYKDMLPYDIKVNPDNAISSFQSVLTAIEKMPYKLYLLIDEYDNFANEVMMSQKAMSQERYKSLLYGEGALKTLFKAVKSAATGRGLDRAFITGVSPVAMSDMTSGYNVAKNISFNPKFNDLCGFWETEIAHSLGQVAQECDYSVEKTEEAIEMMRTYYNGYCFSPEKEVSVYNPTLAVYFMEYFQENCKYPDYLLDLNLAMDKGKLEYIAQLPHGNEIIAGALNDEDPLTVIRLAYGFGVEDMIYAVKDSTFMASLLYFFGMLTIGGKTMFRDLILRVPNLVIRKLYFETLSEKLLPVFTDQKALSKIAKQFYLTGEIQPLCKFIEEKFFTVLSNRDYAHANELIVKIAFLTAVYNENLYIIESETVLQRTYADLTMIVRPDVRKLLLSDFLIEFKFVSLKEAGLSGEKIRTISAEELGQIASVKQKLAEAKSQLEKYSEIIHGKFKNTLRLNVYAVVAVGFERLVWERVGVEN
jgi:hypothetical protein